MAAFPPKDGGTHPAEGGRPTTGFVRVESSGGFLLPAAKIPAAFASSVCYL